MGSGPGVIWTDPYKLRQVLINIINNAVHATDAGGKITTTIETSMNR
jgi:two-component system NtrC family sensor kinase